MDAFELTAGEKSHPLWARLKSHLQDQLGAMRVRNDDQTLTDAQTAALRGRIAAFKQVLALGEDKPVIQVAKTAPF